MIVQYLKLLGKEFFSVLEIRSIRASSFFYHAGRSGRRRLTEFLDYRLPMLVVGKLFDMFYEVK